MKIDEYVQLSARDMARLVRTGAVSPVELTSAALGAVQQTETRLNAWAEVLTESALAQALVLEQEASKGNFRSPLHGVPIGVKDLFLTAGVPTRRGCKLYAHSIPTENSPVVQRMLDGGAVMIGKNTTADSGWKASSNSPLSGVTRNPWDPTKTAGGSSSGSAVAVAAGNVPITLGSDGGGSLRIPASFCGIFSMKPSLGLVPTYPLSPSEHLSHAGPMTNNVADFAAALDLLKGPHVQDPYSLPKDHRHFTAVIEQPFEPLRCVLAPTLFDKKVDPEIEVCINAAFARVRQMRAVRVVEKSLTWPDPIDVFEKLWVARGASKQDYTDDEKGQLDPGLARLIADSTKLSLAGHLQTLQERANFCRTAQRAFQDFDLILMPMLPVQAFAAEADGPADMNLSHPVPWAHWTPFSYPFNVTGQPAASIPCGWTSTGMPIGLQVVGGRFADAQVLQFCAAWEKEFDWHARRPLVFAH